MRTAILLTFLAACGEKKPAEPAADLTTNPAANFQAGLNVLNSPDKKTGKVDYTTAYNYFNASANLQGGAKAHFNAGWTAEKLDDLPGAEKHYAEAFKLDPSYQPAMFSYARVLGDQGKGAQAVDVYKGYVEKNPKDYEVRNDYIGALVKAKLYEAAQAEAEEILRHDPKNAGVYRNLSAMYYDQGNYGMSALCAEKALQLNPGDIGTYNNLGVTMLQQGNEAAAIDKFKTALKLQSNNFESNMNMGWVAVNSGDYKLADASFTAALTQDSRNLDARMGLAIAKRGLADYKAAGELYDEIITGDKDNKAAFNNAAVLNEYYTKDFVKATKYLQAYIDAHPNQIAPTDEIFAHMERIRQLQAEEEERKRQEAERKRLEEERKRRNEETLKEIAAITAAAQAKLTANTACIDPYMAEELAIVFEQAQQIVDAEEADMAPDIKTLLDGYIPQLDEAVAAMCTGATPPAPEGTPPSDGGTPSEGIPPVEGTPPADAAPPGTPPADAAPTDAPEAPPVEAPPGQP